jgi:glycosyltransferase involved in cell wall biosynthesis
MGEAIDVMVDAQAVRGKGGGVPRVARELMQHLPRSDAGRHYHLLCNGESLADFPVDISNLSRSEWLASPQSRLSRIFKQYFFDGRKINRLSPRIFFAPATLLPPGISRKTAKVTLVHDLAPWKVRGIYSPARSLYMKALLRDAVRRADHVVSVSVATKEDLIRVLSVPEKKISVIHNGVSGEIYRRESMELEAHRERLKLPKRYILFVGKIQPRKNLRRLLRAFEAISQRPETKDVHLLLAGQLGWMYGDILTDLRSSAARDKVVLSGFVAERDLLWLYRCASVFSYPSLYEGFGLPILEAMLNGVPVVTSDFGALREIGGTACVTCDPYNLESMIEAHYRALTDIPLRERCITAGCANVARFSWEASAGQYVKVWEQFS